MIRMCTNDVCHPCSKAVGSQGGHDRPFVGFLLDEEMFTLEVAVEIGEVCVGHGTVEDLCECVSTCLSYKSSEHIRCQGYISSGTLMSL